MRREAAEASPVDLARSVWLTLARRPQRHSVDDSDYD
jgi:hypothetical protein